MATKFCKHCGKTIDAECVVCTFCGKQVEELKTGNPNNIVINNSSSTSSSASAAASVYGVPVRRRMPWYATWSGIIIIGFFTGGIYWFIGPFIRGSMKRNNYY